MSRCSITVRAILAISLTGLLPGAANAQAVTPALQAERAGRVQEARELLATAAAEGGSNAEAQLAYAASALAARRLLDEAGGAAVRNRLPCGTCDQP